MTERGTVWRDDQWMTSVPGVFAAGDMQRGQSLIVWAIDDGRRAAAAIDRHRRVPESQRATVKSAPKSDPGGHRPSCHVRRGPLD